MYWILTVVLDPNPQPDLNGNPFLCDSSSIYTGIVYKKDWEWKAEKLPKTRIKFKQKSSSESRKLLCAWSPGKGGLHF